MDSPSKNERCNLISIIKSSTSKRKNRKNQTSTFSYSMPPIHHVSRGHREPVLSSLLSPTSSPRISHKLTKLHRLQIPEIPTVPSVKRHPTVLRAGFPNKQMTLYKDTDISNAQELFMISKSSSVPELTPLSLPQAVPSTAAPTRLVTPSIPRPLPPKVKTFPQLNITSTIDTPRGPILAGNTIKNLIQSTVNLYNTASTLIPPYLFDRLNELNLIEDDLDYEFLQYKSDDPVSLLMSSKMDFQGAIEKMERIQQFLPVLKRVLDLASESLVEERSMRVRN